MPARGAAPGPADEHQQRRRVEEQLADELDEVDAFLTHGTYSHAEALTYLPEPAAFRLGPDQYLEHVRRAREAVGIPIIGSLNGVSRGGWTAYAHAIEQAGAHALELNVYFVPTDPFLESAEIEQEYVDLLGEVLECVSIPVAVKLSPFFTNFASIARRLDEAGARAAWCCSTASTSRTSTSRPSW